MHGKVSKNGFHSKQQENMQKTYAKCGTTSRRKWCQIGESPTKSLFQFAQQMFASASAQTATELLNVHPLRFTECVKQEIIL